MTKTKLYEITKLPQNDVNENLLDGLLSISVLTDDDIISIARRYGVFRTKEELEDIENRKDHIRSIIGCIQQTRYTIEAIEKKSEDDEITVKEYKKLLADKDFLNEQLKELKENLKSCKEALRTLYGIQRVKL